MVAQLLDEDGDIDRGVEAGGGVEGLLQQDVDVPGLAGNGVGTGLVGGQFAIVAGQVIQQRPHLAQARHFVLDHEIGDATLAVYRGAAQFIGGHVLAQNRFHHAGAGQAEKSFVGLDQEAALARQVGAAAGIEAEHAHDAGHHAADLAQGGEGFRIAVEAAHPRGYISSCAVVDTHYRNPLAGGQLEQPGQLGAVGGIHGTGAHGEIVAIERDIAAVDLDDRGHQRGAIQVGTPVLVEHRGFAVAEEADTLPDGHAVLEVLALDILHARRLVGALLQLPAPFQ